MILSSYSVIYVCLDPPTEYQWANHYFRVQFWVRTQKQCKCFQIEKPFWCFSTTSPILVLTALNEFKTIRLKVFAEKLMKLALSFQCIWSHKLFEMISLSLRFTTVDWSLFSWMMPWMKLWIGLLPLVLRNFVDSSIFSRSRIVLKSWDEQQWNWNRFRKILNRN